MVRKRKGGKKKDKGQSDEEKSVEDVWSGEPLEKGYSLVMYAPTSRASCKNCGCAIDKDEPKVGKRVPSRWHHGLDTHWMCRSCGYGRVRRISQLRNWDRLKYEDQLGIRRFTGEMFSPKIEEEIRESMKPLEEIEDLVMYNMKAKQMIETLLLNGIDPVKLNFHRKKEKMGRMIADQMLNGVAEPCRTCKKSTVVTHAYRLRCIGWMQSGFTRCTFVTNPGDLSCKRYAMIIPDSIATKSWLSEWSLRNDHSMFVVNPPKESVVSAARLKQAAPLKQTVKRKHSLDVLCQYEEKLKELSQRNLVKVFRSVTVDEESEPWTKEELIAACISAYRADPDLKRCNLLLLTIPLIKLNFSIRGFDLPGKKISKAKLTELLRSKIAGNSAGSKTETSTPGKKTMTKKTTARSKGSRGDKEKRKFSKRRRDMPPNPSLTDADTQTKSKKKRKKLQPPEEGSSILQLAMTFIEHVWPIGSIFVDPANGVDVYNATLTKVNLKTGYNKFYRMQLIESMGKYIVFRRWGETGNDDGHYYKYNTEHCHHSFFSPEEAMGYFKKVFKEKSGNDFEDRHDFVQKPGFYNYVPLSRVNLKKKRRPTADGVPAGGSDIPSLLPKTTKA